MSQTMEQQVAEAAMAMISPTTISTIRRQASQFLESWTQTVEAWDVYIVWLRSYREGVSGSNNGNSNRIYDDDDQQVSLQLLCLTMLQSKIRREIMMMTTIGSNIHNSGQNNGHNHCHHQVVHPQVIATIRAELWQYIQLPRLHKSLIGPACICNAALIVRCGDMGTFVSHINTSTPTPSHQNDNNSSNDAFTSSSSSSHIIDDVTSLRLLACIPSEMASCQGLSLSPSDVTTELVRYLEPVLDTIRRGLQHQSSSTAITTANTAGKASTVLPACHALKVWAEIAHVSLTQLNAPTCGGPHAVLPSLVSILSRSLEYHQTTLLDVEEELTLQMAAQALTDSILVVSDQWTSTRESAAAAIWQAIPQHGFILNPLQVAMKNEWHDASHALASLLSTFVTEQVEDVVAQPGGVGLQVLLEIQRHPHTPVAIIPLECWLTIQDVDMADRHDDWKRPLYRQLLPILVSRIAYPKHFVNWEEELEVDSSEFDDFRRLVSDVLTSCYFLLRIEMVQYLTQRIRSAADWTESEAALWSLMQISKDVCARCRSFVPATTMVGQDKQATCTELLGLLEQLITSVPVNGQNAQNPVLLAAVVNFCGTYSPAWNSMNCQTSSILHLLAYLQTAFAMFPLDAAKATRAIYVSCLAKNLPSLDDIEDGSTNDKDKSQSPSSDPNILPLVLKSLRVSMDAVLPTTEEEAMVTVAEGATRLVTKLRDPNVARHALTVDLIQPVVNMINTLLQALPDPSVDMSNEVWFQPVAQHAAEALVRCLAVIQVIARFCDAPHIPVMGEWMLEIVGPCLESVQGQTRGTPTQSLVFPKWLAVHQQIIRNTLPQQQMMKEIFTNTIPIVVQVLEQTLDPTTLKYISTAVENFGGKSTEMDRSFQDLLSHFTSVVTRQPNLAELTDLLHAYFDCLQRYTLYCPRALCNNSQFATIMALSVESVHALQAKESTRASLNFMSQLFGFHSRRLSPQSTQILQEAWNPILVDCLAAQGQKLVQYCVAGLAGGSQMLWPAYSECLFSVIQAVILNEASVDDAHIINPNIPNHRNAAGTTSLNESMIEQWLLASLSFTFLSTTTTATTAQSQHLKHMKLETCRAITSILLNLARAGGPKSKPKAKLLLTDFAKIQKGEIKAETIASYALL